MSEYDFLKDEDNIKLVGKISNLIDTQLPDFVKEEGPIFSEFLKLYYRWMESHELTISMVIQDEYHFNLESEQGSFILETSDDLLLEGNRNSSSAYDLNETITGLSSGATGRVDRNTNTASSKIYVTNVTKKQLSINLRHREASSCLPLPNIILTHPQQRIARYTLLKYELT